MDMKHLWQWGENESFVTSASYRTIIIALTDDHIGLIEW
jgi:hypothetical protein